MAEPALGGKREVQEDCGYAAAGDEKRFQTLSTNVGYISYVLVGAHGGVVRVSFNLPDDEHSEEHAKPGECADEREQPDEGIFEDRGGHDG